MYICIHVYIYMLEGPTDDLKKYLLNSSSSIITKSFIQHPFF